MTAAFHADFNEQDDEGRLAVLMPEAGEEIELRDGDGNTCRGRIEQVEGRLASVLLDWTTWSPSVLRCQPVARNTNPVGNPKLVYITKGTPPT